MCQGVSHFSGFLFASLFVVQISHQQNKGESYHVGIHLIALAVFSQMHTHMQGFSHFSIFLHHLY